MRRIPSALVAAALAGVLLGPSAADAQQQPKLPTFRKNMPYADARAAMIKAGFHPVAFPRVEDEDESSGRCGSRGFICDAYPEAEACADTGIGQCSFVFAAGPNTVVRITTGGGELEGLVVLATERKQCSADQVRRDMCR